MYGTIRNPPLRAGKYVHKKEFYESFSNIPQSIPSYYPKGRPIASEKEVKEVKKDVKQTTISPILVGALLFVGVCIIIAALIIS